MRGDAASTDTASHPDDGGAEEVDVRMRVLRTTMDVLGPREVFVGVVAAIAAVSVSGAALVTWSNQRAAILTERVDLWKDRYELSREIVEHQDARTPSSGVQTVSPSDSLPSPQTHTGPADVGASFDEPHNERTTSQASESSASSGASSDDATLNALRAQTRSDDLLVWGRLGDPGASTWISFIEGDRFWPILDVGSRGQSDVRFEYRVALPAHVSSGTIVLATASRSTADLLARHLLESSGRVPLYLPSLRDVQIRARVPLAQATKKGVT